MARNPDQHLGWQPDFPDHRDLLYSAPTELLGALPAQVDLRPQCPPVYDQEHLGSCTANAIAGAIEFDRLKAQQNPDFVPSRLFIYYNERAAENHIPYDAGARIRDGIKTVRSLGVCPEDDWKYSDAGAPAQEGGAFAPGAPAAQKPTPNCYKDALAYRVITYLRLAQNLSQLKGCLAQGYPFVFGFVIYDNFWDANGVPQTVTPMPTGNPVGGHAVVAVGYDDATSRFTIRNSWGDTVLDHGYYYMPYAYVTDQSLANDLWTIRGMSA